MAGSSIPFRNGTEGTRLVAAGMVLLSLVAVYLPPSTQQAVGHAIRQTVLWPFVRINIALTQVQDRTREFEILRSQIDAATGVLASQRTLAEENRRLRELLALPERESRSYVSTTVVRVGTTGSESSFRLGLGANDGITSQTAVVTDAGLLGQVVEVRPTYSVAIDWSHPDFRVSAMTADGARHGLVEVETGRFREQDQLVMRGLASLSDLEPGAEILTSGRGGVFPRGILIGWVSEPATGEEGWSQSYYLTPAAHPGDATHAALVLDSASGGPATTGDPAASATGAATDPAAPGGGDATGPAPGATGPAPGDATVTSQANLTVMFSADATRSSPSATNDAGPTADYPAPTP